MITKGLCNLKYESLRMSLEHPTSRPQPADVVESKPVAKAGYSMQKDQRATQPYHSCH